MREDRSPFRGLKYFTDKDATVFVGREEEIEEVSTRILAGTTLVVYGPSGVGKTSLLRAGVVPELEKQRGYRATYVRPLRSPHDDVWQALGADPAKPLAVAIARLPKLPGPTAGAATAPDAHASHGPTIPPPMVADDGGEPEPGARVPHVLILDQIEELFTRFEEPQRRPLWNGLVELIDDPTPVRLVLALREDYLHLLDSAHPRLSNLLDRRFRLRGLTSFGARTAIVRPLIDGNIRYAPELIDRCVADLTEVPPGHPEEDGVVDPLLLQIVCSEVYWRAEQREPGHPLLTLADYTASGGPAGVFRRHLDELFNRVHASDQLLLALVLQEMTTAHATKRPATVSRLLQSGLLAPGPVIQDLLDKLVSASLVRAYPADPEPWYELVHDRLVTALPEQFARNQQFLQIRFMRDLVRQLCKGFSEGVASAPLLSEQQLADVVEPFRTYIRFDNEELNLLFRSAVATEHEMTAWRDAYEAAMPAGTPAVLLDMLGREATRRAAARAVAILRVTEPAIRDECVRLALHDSDLRVEEAATEALNAVAGEAEAKRMAVALKDTSLRPRALRVLGALVQHPAIRTEVRRRDLRKAERFRNRTRIRAAKDAIQRAGREGQLEGLWTGGLAGLIATVFFYIVWAWTGEGPDAGLAIGACLVGGGSATVGVVCGRAAARAMARLRAIDHSVSWVGATRAPGLLLTFTVVPIAGISVLCKLLGAELSETVQIAVLATAVSVMALPISVITIGLVSYLLEEVRWHRVRTRAWILLGTVPIAWLFTITIGYLYWTFFHVDISFLELSLDDGSIIIALFLCGAWCSVCAAATSGALAEAARHLTPLAPARSPWRKILGLAPTPLFLLILLVLLHDAPPPLLAPVYDATDGVEGQAPPEPFRITSASWTGGRWVRIRNLSREPRIIVTAHRSQKPELYVLWADTYPIWIRERVLPIEIQQPYRRIIWGKEPPAPGTYTIVTLERSGTTDGFATWKPLDLGAQADHVTAQLVGCRVTLSSGTTKCTGRFSFQDCSLNEETRAKYLPSGVICAEDGRSKVEGSIVGVFIFGAKDLESATPSAPASPSTGTGPTSP